MPARATAPAPAVKPRADRKPTKMALDAPLQPQNATSTTNSNTNPTVASGGGPHGKSGFPWFSSMLRTGSSTDIAMGMPMPVSKSVSSSASASAAASMAAAPSKSTQDAGDQHSRPVRLVSMGEDEMENAEAAANSAERSNQEDHDAPPLSRPRAPKADESDILAWENPSYLVKDLDTGESYHVEEIDHQFNLVTLDSVAQQRGGSKDGQESEASTSAYLLSLYTADETADIEFEEDAQEIELEHATSEGSFSMDLTDECGVRDPMECQFEGCTVVHQRPSGFCADHEVIAKEEEDSRVQALYLIPMGARAEFVKISGHGLAHDASNRLYTVYIIEMRCIQSGATWNVYRRYQEFKELNDRLRPMGVRVPLLPPKKLIGSFEPDFVARRQQELSEWLRSLLDYDRVDESAKNPHLINDVRKFLTAKADQSPLLMEQLPVKKSRPFGDSFMDEDDDKANHRRTTLQDFKMLQVIGRGSFGKVVLVGHRETKKLYAMKILSKENIVKRKQVEHTRTERRVLGYTRHPFIVGLHYAFQTPQRLYFVLDYCPGGELFYHLSRMKKLPEHMACFYAAEITLALEHLHGLGVVYRDLKPENILLTKDGHIMLADFGLAKEGIRDGVYGTNSLCGTPEYLPPEILDRLGHGTAVDWWNLGMVLYEMLTGLPPWYTNDRKRLFERLRSARLHFPPYVSRRAEALIRQLLNRNPAERLGARGAHQVKNHLFFETIDWARLAKKQLPPPFRPCHTALNDGEAPLNFEAEFTRLPLPSVDQHDGVSSGRAGAPNTANSRRLRRADSDTFQGFTYENPSYLEAIEAQEHAV